jgi:hypothetical protein
MRSRKAASERLASAWREVVLAKRPLRWRRRPFISFCHSGVQSVAIGLLCWNSSFSKLKVSRASFQTTETDLASHPAVLDLLPDPIGQGHGYHVLSSPRTTI